MLKVNDLQIKEFGMEIKSCYFCNRLTEAESERRWVEFCFCIRQTTRKINHRKLNGKWERKYFWHYLSFLCSEWALLLSPNRLVIPARSASVILVSEGWLLTSQEEKSQQLLLHRRPCCLLQWQAVMQAWGCITIQKTTQKNRRNEKWKNYFGSWQLSLWALQ